MFILISDVCVCVMFRYFKCIYLLYKIINIFLFRILSQITYCLKWDLNYCKKKKTLDWMNGLIIRDRNQISFVQMLTSIHTFTKTKIVRNKTGYVVTAGIPRWSGIKIRFCIKLVHSEKALV